MIRLLLVNEMFADPIGYRRWELFAESYSDIDLYLLAPKTVAYGQGKDTFGQNLEFKSEIINKRNFHIILFDKINVKGIGWLSKDFKKYIKDLHPDIIYNIGTHNQPSLMQLIYLRNTFCPKAKIISFSMRGPNYNISHFKDKCSPVFRYLKRRYIAYIYMKYVLKYFNKNVDAVFCHYPDALKCFREEGFKGPIYMQTQVGVNPELYYENKEARDLIRKKYHVKDDEFLFGSASRFTTMKGLDDILLALPNDGKWKYMMIGSGSQEDLRRLNALISKRGFEDRVIVPGFVPQDQMPQYFNAIDCMLHVPRTAYSWVETFSVALVQAMITGKAVIGSNSGSVPYQIGPDGIIVHEGDQEELRQRMQWMLHNQENAKELGIKMKERAEKCFSIIKLNEMFYYTITEDICQGNYDSNKIDMTNFSL